MHQFSLFVKVRNAKLLRVHEHIPANFLRDISVRFLSWATTRSFPKIPKEVRSLPKKFEVFLRRPKSSEVLGCV